MYDNTRYDAQSSYETFVILDPVKEDDAQQETISIWSVIVWCTSLMVWYPFCLDKDLNPPEVFLLLYTTINTLWILNDLCRNSAQKP